MLIPNLLSNSLIRIFSISFDGWILALYVLGSCLVRNHLPRPSARPGNRSEGRKLHPQDGRKPQQLWVYGRSQPSRVGARVARAPWEAVNPHKPPVFGVYGLPLGGVYGLPLDFLASRKAVGGCCVPKTLPLALFFTKANGKVRNHRSFGSVHTK